MEEGKGNKAKEDISWWEKGVKEEERKEEGRRKKGVRGKKRESG